MSKTYNNYEPIPLKFLKSDGTLTDTLPIGGSGEGGAENVNVQNFPKWQGVGNILQGTVAQGEEKMIAVDGATAIWIQADAANTSPLLVSNIQGFEGASVHPGSSEWFYYPTVYVKHNDANAQGIAYQAVKYG